jgi:APA family basic amino acid/polyamine antiporter
MVDVSHDVPGTSVRGGMFVRKATGLVRDVSPVSAGIFNLIVTAPAVGLAISVFWLLAVLPGPHVIAAYWLTAVLALAIVGCVGSLMMAMPRSGGDYILVSRSLGPPFGLASSVSLFVAQILAATIVAYWFVTVGVIPGLATIGAVSGNSFWTDLSADLSSKGWTFALSIAALLLFGTGMSAISVRRASRIQNVTFAVGMAGLVVGIIAMVAISKGSFISSFNDAAGKPDSYQTILRKIDVAAPDTSWTNTLPSMAALSLFLCFSWWSAHYGGEVRAAQTWKTLAAMGGTVILSVVLYTIGTLALFHMVGSTFVADVNAANGTATYPLGVPPYWHVLVSIGSGSTLLAVFLTVTLLFWFPAWEWTQFVQPVRAMFAWSFDGLLPKGATYVHPRTGTPWVALGVTTLLATGTTIWAIWGSTFFTLLATLTVLLAIPLTLIGLSAMALPYLKPEIWKRCPFPIKVAGVPLLTLQGALGTVTGVFIAYMLFKYPELGVTNKTTTLIIMGLCVLGSFVYYYVARELIRRRSGVDIALNYREIPPE